MELSKILKALEHDNFYALYFDEALPEIQRCLYSYLGTVPLSASNGPSTDGKKIFLSSVIARFKDSKEKLSENRNMSLFLSDLIHEMLHIREGSFLIDSSSYLDSFDNKALAHAINNIIDDARIEHNGQAYLRIEDVELLEESNKYCSRSRSVPSSLFEQFFEIFSCSLITKRSIDELNPAYCEIKKSVLTKEIENEELISSGLKNLGDVLSEMISLSEKTYGRPVESVLAVLPKVYDIVKKAFPDIEKSFPEKNSPYSPAKSRSGRTSDENDEEDTQTANAKKKKSQSLFAGYRGDIHDFSHAQKSEIKDIEAIVQEFVKQEALLLIKDSQNSEDESDPGVLNSKKLNQEHLNPDTQSSLVLSSAYPGVGASNSNAPVSEQPRYVQVVTYDDLKKAYIHLQALRILNYPSVNPNFIAELQKYDDIRRAITEHFELLKPNKLQRILISESPDELNIESVIDIISDCSLRGDLNIYDSFLINRRESLTAILLDISGSTGSSLRSNKTVLEVEKISAGLITRALQEIGDDVLLYAFSTGDITNLYKLSDLENLGALKPEYANADGVAIRGVISEIKQANVKDSTLIVISDGKPVGSYSQGDPVVDTSMAFMEAESLGIRTVYFNVDNNAPSYFNILARHTTYARSIRKVEQLPGIISEFVMEHL